LFRSLGYAMLGIRFGLVQVPSLAGLPQGAVPRTVEPGVTWLRTNRGGREGVPGKPEGTTSKSESQPGDMTFSSVIPNEETSKLSAARSPNLGGGKAPKATHRQKGNLPTRGSKGRIVHVLRYTSVTGGASTP